MVHHSREGTVTGEARGCDSKNAKQLVTLCIGKEQELKADTQLVFSGVYECVLCVCVSLCMCAHVSVCLCMCLCFRACGVCMCVCVARARVFHSAKAQSSRDSTAYTQRGSSLLS